MIDPDFRYTTELLEKYSEAALENSSELIEEATLLYDHGHYARAYFLAVASLEETGKAMIAFDGLGRNLQDSAVTARLRRSMEDHSSKITAAFTATLKTQEFIQSEAETAIEIMINLKNGREPSMYSDINYQDLRVIKPKNVVRDVAARDCIQLARDCFNATSKHITEKEPDKRSRSEDEYYSMKPGAQSRILNSQDFWEYYISRLQLGERDFPGAVSSYHRDFYLKGKTFAPTPGEENSDL